MEADESKVKALENIFGGDITASVIRTVLTTNDNKFDEAVDSLLNMSNDTINKNNSTKPKEEEEDEALLERKQRDKIRTLENMFGNDLSNSVICTVLESNKGELVDTVDTLLNMTSKDINPYQVEQVNQGEAERLKHEEELRDYEQFKALQLKLQEEEVKAMQEAKRKSDESAALKAQEERKRKEMMEEQERLIREFESQKKAQEAETQAKVAEQEKKRAELVQAQQKLAVLEKKKEEEEARRKNEEEARRKELAIQEKRLRLKAQEQEEALLEFRREEERKINEKKLQLEELVRQAEKQKAEEAARMQEEVLKKEKALQAMFEAQKLKEREIETQRILMEEEKLREKIDSERQAHLRKLEEERVADQKRRALEEERISLQRERELVEEMRREQENKSRLKAEAKARKEEAQRIALEHEKRLAMEAKARQEEEARLAEESRIRREEEQRRMEQERLEREEAEQRRAEQERARQAEEAARLKEEEARHAILREEANRQALLIEEERRKKLAYDQIAASAVFIPPKSEVVGDAITVTSEVSGDLVTCTWDIPEGNAAVTNWLGLYPSHQPLNTNKYVQFVYTNGSSTGQHVFRGVTPGHYEVRFFNTRGYEHAARGPKIRVGPSATLMCQLQGDHLRAHYTLDPLSTTPTREWLGIYEKTQRRNKKYLSSAYGNAEGQVLLSAPRIPGVYEVRLFAAGAVYNDQARMEFVVEDNDCINVESSFVNAGANVNVNWVLRTLEPSSSDWIGLYRADEANNTNYLSSTYTQGSSVGSIAIQAPKEVGVYEFRLFVRAKGKYTTFRTSQPLTVIPVV